MATGPASVVATIHKPRLADSPPELCSCSVLLEVQCALEIEVYGTVSRGGLQNKLNYLEVCDRCKSNWTPITCVDVFVLCTGKALQGDVLMVPLEKKQNLCYKRPSGAGQQGYVYTTIGSTVVPKMCEVFRESPNFSVVRKSCYPACLSSPLLPWLKCQGCVWRGSPFLLFWSDCLMLWVGKQLSPHSPVDRLVPSLGWCPSLCCSAPAAVCSAQVEAWRATWIMSASPCPCTSILSSSFERVQSSVLFFNVWKVMKSGRGSVMHNSGWEFVMV